MTNLVMVGLLETITIIHVTHSLPRLRVFLDIKSSISTPPMLTPQSLSKQRAPISNESCPDVVFVLKDDHDEQLHANKGVIVAESDMFRNDMREEAREGGGRMHFNFMRWLIGIKK